MTSLTARLTTAEMPTEGVRVRTDAAVHALVNQYYDFVWRSLRRLGMHPGDVEDAAQEVFLSVSKRFTDIVPGCEKGFLYRTAVNHARHAHRVRFRRREVQFDGAHEELLTAPAPDELVDKERARALLFRLLDVLDFDERTVFVLYELEELTMAEAAEFLEVPLGTVASRLRRARAKLEAAAHRCALRERWSP